MHNIGLIRISDKLNKEIEDNMYSKNNNISNKISDYMFFIVTILLYVLILLYDDKVRNTSNNNINNNFNYFNKESTVVEIDFINLLIPTYSTINDTQEFKQRLSFDKLFYLNFNNQLNLRIDTIYSDENKYYIFTPIIYFTFSKDGKYSLHYSPGHTFHNDLSLKVFNLVEKELFKIQEEYIYYIVNINNLYTNALININQTTKFVSI